VKIGFARRSITRDGNINDTTIGKFIIHAPHQKGYLKVQPRAQNTWMGEATYATEKTDAARKPTVRSKVEPGGRQRVGLSRTMAAKYGNDDQR